MSTETKKQEMKKCLRCGDPHTEEYSVQCAECGPTTEEQKLTRIDNLIEKLDIAFNEFNAELDDEGELKESASYFIDWIINTVMEFYTKDEMAEVVKYIALNMNIPSD